MFDKFARCRCREIFTSAKNFGVVFIPELWIKKFHPKIIERNKSANF
jgi:hypothetical protein